MNLIRRITAIALSLSLMNITGCETSTNEDVTSDNINLSAQSLIKSSGTAADLSGYTPNVLFKADRGFNNPLITNIFCADPTSVEYNGRLYVYGTNDNQQYLEKPNSANAISYCEDRADVVLYDC